MNKRSSTDAVNTVPVTDWFFLQTTSEAAGQDSVRHAWVVGMSSHKHRGHLNSQGSYGTYMPGDKSLGPMKHLAHTEFHTVPGLEESTMMPSTRAI